MATKSFLYLGTELDAMNEAENYYRWILSHFASYVGGRVIEVGAGIGNFAGFLLKSTNVSELVLVEPADNLFPFLHQRFSGDSRVKLVHGYLEDLSNTPHLSADSVILVNVLEHIADDQAFLQLAYQLLIRGGTILLFVPALLQLNGSLDEAFGHYRRYTKSSLSYKLQRAGFQTVYLRHFNFPGVISWFLAGKVLRRRALRPMGVRLYDQWVVPWISKLERHWEPPIGQSLIAIAKK